MAEPPAASVTAIEYWERSCARFALLWLILESSVVLEALFASPQRFLSYFQTSALLAGQIVSEGGVDFGNAPFVLEIGMSAIFGHCLLACFIAVPMLAVVRKRRWLLSSVMLWTLMLGFSLAGLIGSIGLIYLTYAEAGLPLPWSKFLFQSAFFGLPTLISAYALRRAYLSRK